MGSMWAARWVCLAREMEGRSKCGTRNSAARPTKIKTRYVRLTAAQNTRRSNCGTHIWRRRTHEDQNSVRAFFGETCEDQNSVRASGRHAEHTRFKTRYTRSQIQTRYAHVAARPAKIESRCANSERSFADARKAGVCRGAEVGAWWALRKFRGRGGGKSLCGGRQSAPPPPPQPYPTIPWGGGGLGTPDA